MQGINCNSTLTRFTAKVRWRRPAMSAVASARASAWLLLLLPLGAQSQCSVAEKDPHLHFAHGGEADFRGHNGQLYSMFSAPDFAVNIKTEDATFEINKNHKHLIVDGSFITEVHVVARVGGAKRKPLHASFWASELNEFNTGWKVVNGTCGFFGTFVVGLGHSRTCEEFSVALGFSTGTFAFGNSWAVKVSSNSVYGRVSGPAHRLDVSIRGVGDAAARSLPHGLIGQSFSSPAARKGKLDAYPLLGRMRTSAMAEGAIEGSAAMYEVPSAYSTRFAFSRFDAPLEPPSSAGDLLGGEASAHDDAAAGEAFIAPAAPPSHRRASERFLPPCLPPSTPTCGADCSSHDVYCDGQVITGYDRMKSIANDGNCCEASRADSAYCGYEVHGSICELFVGTDCSIARRRHRVLQESPGDPPDATYLKVPPTPPASPPPIRPSPSPPPPSRPPPLPPPSPPPPLPPPSPPPPSPLPSPPPPSPLPSPPPPSLPPPSAPPSPPSSTSELTTT